MQLLSTLNSFGKKVDQRQQCHALLSGHGYVAQLVILIIHSQRSLAQGSLCHHYCTQNSTPGFSWSDKDGFNVSPEQEDQFNILVAVCTFTLHWEKGFILNLGICIGKWMNI